MQQPKISPVPFKSEYIFEEDYSFTYGDIKITIPKFFLFDGASIPTYAQPIIYPPFHPLVITAASVHDWLYINHQVDFSLANQIFYDILILNSVSVIKAKMMFKAVELFGRSSWKRSDKDKEKLEILYILIKDSDNFNSYYFPADFS